MPTNSKPKRADGQMTGLAGEFFVAAELLKRCHQTSVTFGNAKALDLFTRNPKTGRTFTVRVKALRARDYFPIGHSKIVPTHTYVLVLLNRPGQAVQYYVVAGETLAREPEKFGKWFKYPKMPGIHQKIFQELGFEDAWEVFDQAQP